LPTTDKKEEAQPAASAGAFSFGGAAATVTTDKKDETKPTAGGFSFGGSTAASTTEKKEATTTPAPSAGGFSFGGATESTSTTDKKDDAKVPAPALAAASGGFSFGGASTPATTGDKKDDANKTSFGVSTPTPGTGASTTTSDGNKSTATTSTTKAITVVPPPPIPYQTKSIQDIINTFTAELEIDAKTFFAEAQRISEYDAILRDSQRSITHLTENMSRLLIQQTEVDNTLNSIGSYHSELNEILNGLETNMDDLFEAQKHLVPEDGDLERERAYQLALDIETKLSNMQMSMKDTVDDLNRSAERASEGNSNGSGSGSEENIQILQILNAHLDTLTWLEGAGKSLDEDVTLLGRALAE